nr:MAG TPA: hypothetical protein [Caudoviricetes sp.]
MQMILFMKTPRPRIICIIRKEMNYKKVGILLRIRHLLCLILKELIEIENMSPY